MNLSDMPIDGYAVFYHNDKGEAQQETFTKEVHAQAFAATFEKDNPGSTLIVPVLATVAVKPQEKEPVPLETGKAAYLAAMNLIRSQGKAVDKVAVLNQLVTIYKDGSLYTARQDDMIRSVLKTLSNTLDGL